jgi:hypothetical protein
METALSIGYDRLEAAALQAGLAAMRGDGKTSAWQVRSAGTPLPPMSWDQAFQLLCMHQRTQRLGREHRTQRLPHFEFNEAIRMVDRALRADERSMHFALTGRWRLPREQAPPDLPPLHLVTGWSRADPNRVKHNPNLALFGGWRIGDLEKKRRGSG